MASATTTAPVAAFTSLVGADWPAMHEQASAATTVADADRMARRLDGTIGADLGPHARRALFALARVPLDDWQPSGPHDAYSFHLAADPLLTELRVGGFAASRTELDHLGPPATLTVRVDQPAWGRARVSVGSWSGEWLATLIVFGPAMPSPEGPPATLGDDADLAAHIVERVRVRGLPGGRAPGRPPAATIALRSMNARHRMLVAAELVESGNYSQTAAASYAGVSRESLNRRLRARRLERLTLGTVVDGGHGVRLAPIQR